MTLEQPGTPKPQPPLPKIVQPPSDATRNRALAVGVGVPVLVTAITAVLVWVGEVVQYMHPGFPIIKDPVYLSAIASTIAGYAAGTAAYRMRGTRAARRATDPDPDAEGA